MYKAGGRDGSPLQYVERGSSLEINSHEINSREINSNQINSREINVSRDQLP